MPYRDKQKQRDYHRGWRARHRGTIRRAQQISRARAGRQGCGLGARQRQILLLAYERACQGHDVLLHHDIFTEIYGWTVTPSSWGAQFNPTEIGLEVYRAATVEIAKSVTALCQRGLIERTERRGQLRLTAEGTALAEVLYAEAQAEAEAARLASLQGTLF